MRLLCKPTGAVNARFVALDLMAGAALSFKKTNPLFAFDTVSCERSLSFDLPSTRRNEEILKLAKIPAYDGEGMRRRFEAELQDGLVVKQGYLYVSEYGDKYKAVFVTGELLGLKKIKDLGNVSEIIAPEDIVHYGELPVPAHDAVGQGWATVEYIEIGGLRFPSVRVKYILDLVTERYVLPTIYVPSGTENLRLIPTKLNRPKERNGTLRSEVGGVRIDEAFARMLASDTMEVRGYNISAVPTGGGYYEEHIEYADPVGVPAFRALHDLIITFGTDVQSDIYIKTRTGAGQKVTGKQFYMRSGDTFFLYYAGDVEIEQGTTPYYEEYGVFFYESSLAWTFNYSSHFYTVHATIGIQGSGDWQDGEEVFLQDNLPDVSVVDILKMVAAMSGTVLNYTDENGITFDPVSVDGWEVKNLTGTIIKVQSVKRTFADYARENVVEFDSGEWVLGRERDVYVIDNDNLDESSTLLEIPFSEGMMENGTYNVVVDNEQANGAFVVADAKADAYNMTRVRLRKCDGVQNLCDESTTIQVQARMTLADYESLKAKTLLLIDGTRYVWTDAQYSKGVVTLKLSKIPTKPW